MHITHNLGEEQCRKFHEPAQIHRNEALSTVTQEQYRESRIIEKNIREKHGTISQKSK